MPRRVIRRTIDPFETLERMLNKTTLVTQRVGHDHITALKLAQRADGQIYPILSVQRLCAVLEYGLNSVTTEIGNKILDATRVDDQGEKQKTIEDAVESAEARATRELRAGLKRLTRDKDEERRRALDKQKWYFDRLAARISDQRDRAEAERMRELRKKLDKDKVEALKQQWEECERLKNEAVKLACIELRKELRIEFIVERDRAVADALRKAREEFKKRELEIIEHTREMCEDAARREAERVEALHRAEVDGLNHRYNILQRKYDKELVHKQQVEKDFRALQIDYKRFMDHTDGKFHSDYLMHLRHLGMRLAEKDISTVTYEDIEPVNSRHCVQPS